MEQVTSASAYTEPVLGAFPRRDEVRIIPMKNEITADRMVYRWQLVFGDVGPYAISSPLEVLDLPAAALPRKDQQQVVNLEVEITRGSFVTLPANADAFDKSLNDAYTFVVTCRSLSTRYKIAPWKEQPYPWHGELNAGMQADPSIPLEKAFAPLFQQETVLKLPARLRFVDSKVEAFDYSSVLIEGRSHSFIVPSARGLKSDPRIREIERRGWRYGVIPQDTPRSKGEELGGVWKIDKATE
jgi:hypothetical protein